MAQLSADIVADILSRLPVEAILRFRCVSKPWCALIDSHHFVRMHLKRSIDTKSNRQLILTTSDRSNLYSVSMYSLDVAVELDLPPLKKKNCIDHLDVLGSCDGLVLLRRMRDQVSIWNPSTRTYQVLPVIAATPYLGFLKEEFYGIGYDSVHDDYKVINIIRFRAVQNVAFSIGEKNVTLCSQVQVYSLKTNSWAKITADFPYHLDAGKSGGVLANGALHWAASEIDNGDYRFLVAFDLTTMDYRLMPMPSFDDKEKSCFITEVAAPEGCLCILRVYWYDPSDVWVMKKYRVNESWTKLLSVTQPQNFTFFFRLIPVAFSEDGTKILLLQGMFQDKRELVWCDLQHNVVMTVNLCGLPNIYCAEFCMQSLVPLGRNDTSSGMKLPKEESKDKKPKGNGKKRGGVVLEGSSSRSTQVKKD